MATGKTTRVTRLPKGRNVAPIVPGFGPICDLHRYDDNFSIWMDIKAKFVMPDNGHLPSLGNRPYHSRIPGKYS